MATDKLLSTHSSILLAGGLIAAALYLGLRAQRTASPPAPGAPPSPAAAPPSDRDTTAPPRPSLPRVRAQPTTGAIDRSAATAAAREDLERHRAEVVRRCLASTPGDRLAPQGVKLRLNMTFDAEGRQISRGVSEDRATYREGVSACAMSTLPALRIPPQGAPVYVEVPWTLL